MKVIALSFCLLASSLVMAQTKSEVKKMPMATNPTDSATQLLCYTRVLNSELADSIIYKRSVHWYKTAYKSMRIVNEECIPGEKIVGRGETDLLGLKEGGKQNKGGRLKYTFTTSIDNGKITTTFSRLNMANSVYTPIEPWLKLQDDDLRYKYYFIFIEEYAATMFDSFNELVNVKMMK